MERWPCQLFGITTDTLPALRQLIWIPLLGLLPHLVIVPTATCVAGKGRAWLQPGLGLALYSYLLGTVVMVCVGSLQLPYAVAFYLPVFAFRAWLHYRDKRQAFAQAAFSAIVSLVAWQTIFPILRSWEC